MRKELCNNLDIKHLAGGNLLFDHGDEDNCIYLVRRGVLTMFIADEVLDHIPMTEILNNSAICCIMSPIDQCVIIGLKKVTFRICQRKYKT